MLFLTILVVKKLQIWKRKSHTVAFIAFLLFIVARREGFTVQSGMFLAGDKPRRRSRSMDIRTPHCSLPLFLCQFIVFSCLWFFGGPNCSAFFQPLSAEQRY